MASMASSSSSSPAEPTVDSLLPHSNGAPTASASDISAAASLATLSESRPSTSLGEHGEELDDDQTGGISLLTDMSGGTSDAAYFTAPFPPDLEATVAIVAGEAGEALGGDSLPEAMDTMLDQHIVPAETLTIEQYPPHTSSWASAAEFAAAVYDLDLNPSASAQDIYLSRLDNIRFLPITFFFRHCVDFARDERIDLDVTPAPPTITRKDLRGDECDIQGIDWTLRHTTRATVRAKRAMYESNRMSPQVQAVRRGMVPTPDTGNHFSFKQMNTNHQASIAHFQLRNLMATTSRNDVFYAKNNVVLRTDAAGAPAKTAMNLTKALTEMGGFQITTLAASDDILIAGGFEGEYAFQNMSDDPNTATTVGRTKDRSRESRSWITNHIHLFGSRNNYTPQAVLCSNDSRLRILDCTTNTFTHSFDFPLAVNCAATSPDGRMRVVVGDFRETLITNAETGQSFETLNSHTDDVFACDWADDGIHVATAAQDSTIVIWDARYWGRPLKVMHSELSIPRILRFSPVGSGPRVLVSAEADDYVNIYDAQTYESRQLLDFFGSTAGISMTADGSSLFVANSDVDFGGIMEFERCEWGSKRGDDVWEGNWGYMNAAVKNDWGYEKDMDQDRRVVCGWHARERRGLDLGELVV